MSIQRTPGRGELLYRYLAIAHSLAVVAGASLLALTVLLVRVLGWLRPPWSGSSIGFILFALFVFVSVSDLSVANAWTIGWLTRPERVAQTRAGYVQAALVGFGFAFAPAVYGTALLLATGQTWLALLLSLMSLLHALALQSSLSRVRTLN